MIRTLIMTYHIVSQKGGARNHIGYSGSRNSANSLVAHLEIIWFFIAASQKYKRHRLIIID